MKSLTGPILKSLVFIVITVLATTVLALTITNRSSNGTRYNAVFSDVTGLHTGDDIRMAGVRVGQVTSISITKHREAKIGFTVQSDVRLATTVQALVRYRNLIGQRYVELSEGSGALSKHFRAGQTIRNTAPALDLTVLFNGFEPLFQALSPTQINSLTASIIQVFQGEGPTIGDLVEQTASLTNTLADKDTVIGRVIDNLNSVLTAVNGRGAQLSTLIATLRSLVSGLAQDRAPLGQAVSSIGHLTTDVSNLLAQGRAPLRASIKSLTTLSANLAGSSGALNSFLQTLPGKLNTIGRTLSYGSWVNFYVCSITGRIPVPGYNPDGSGAKYYGTVGVQPEAQRCSQ